MGSKLWKCGTEMEENYVRDLDGGSGLYMQRLSMIMGIQLFVE